MPICEWCGLGHPQSPRAWEGPNCGYEYYGSTNEMESIKGLFQLIEILRDRIKRLENQVAKRVDGGPLPFQGSTNPGSEEEKPHYKARCNGCGYDGGPTGDDWKDTASAYTWGKCPRCGTTNLDVESTCETCGTKESTVYGNLKRCLKCFPATPEEKITGSA